MSNLEIRTVFQKEICWREDPIVCSLQVALDWFCKQLKGQMEAQKLKFQSPKLDAVSQN